MTQVILIAGSMVLAWEAIGRRRPKSERYRAMRLEKVTFFIAVWFAGATGTIVYSVIAARWPNLIAAASLLAWNVAGMVVLAVMPGSRLLRAAAVATILAVIV